MGEGSFEDVAEDFHVPVGMCWKAHARSDYIVIDDAKASEAHVGGVEIIGETEGVEGPQPAVVGVTSVVGFTDDHVVGMGSAWHMLRMGRVSKGLQC